MRSLPQDISTTFLVPNVNSSVFDNCVKVFLVVFLGCVWFRVHMDVTMVWMHSSCSSCSLYSRSTCRCFLQYGVNVCLVVLPQEIGFQENIQVFFVMACGLPCNMSGSREYVNVTMVRCFPRSCPRSTVSLQYSFLAVPSPGSTVFSQYSFLVV